MLRAIRSSLPQASIKIFCDLLRGRRSGAAVLRIAPAVVAAARPAQILPARPDALGLARLVDPVVKRPSTRTRDPMDIAAATVLLARLPEGSKSRLAILRSVSRTLSKVAVERGPSLKARYGFLPFRKNHSICLCDTWNLAQIIY